MKRRSSLKTAEALELVLSVTRRRGAPKEPSSDKLKKLFCRAWELVPQELLPDLPGHARVAVDVLVVADDEIAALNAAHLKERGPTDVISYTMGEIDPERGAYHLGEIVASHATAAREAEARGLPPDEELARYCVHGFLHLLGYEDETAAQRKAMFAIQEKTLADRPFKK